MVDNGPKKRDRLIDAYFNDNSKIADSNSQVNNKILQLKYSKYFDDYDETNSNKAHSYQVKNSVENSKRPRCQI